MKLKQRHWILIGILAIILALVRRSGGFREGFNSVPIFKGDYNTDKPLIDKLTNMAKSVGIKETDEVIRIASNYGSTYTSSTSVPTKDEFVSQVSNGKLTSYSQVTGDDKLSIDVVYSYFYGSSPSISTSSSTTPSPASSSSTQPMTLSVPSPCRPSYKSIPGGSMEFKCFS